MKQDKCKCNTYKGKKETGCKCETLGCDCNIIHADKVEKVKKSILDDDTLMGMADLYRAFSDSTRIKIIAALEREEMCVCDIAVILNMTKSAVSHQLKYLREMNLIKFKKEGKVVFYSLADEHVKQLLDISLEHIKELRNEG